MSEYTERIAKYYKRKQTTEERSDSTACSGYSFEWITPDDPRWEQWRQRDEKILVMTPDGPVVVRVPENDHPWYHCFDDEELADPEEWTAWSRIPRLQNAQGDSQSPDQKS